MHLHRLPRVIIHTPGLVGLLSFSPSSRVIQHRDLPAFCFLFAGYGAGFAAFAARGVMMTMMFVMISMADLWAWFWMPRHMSSAVLSPSSRQGAREEDSLVPAFVGFSGDGSVGTWWTWNDVGWLLSYFCTRDRYSIGSGTWFL